MKQKKQLPAYIVLCAICVIAGLLLALVYTVTEKPIARQQEQSLKAACEQMLPEAKTFTLTEAEGFSYYEGLDADGRVCGYVAINTVMGFGGEIELVVGTDVQGTLTGLQVGGRNFSETAGLGAKTKEPAFTEQFAGKAYPLELVRNGGEIDAVTSATISSSAVVSGVNDALNKLSAAGCITLAGTAAFADGEYTVKASGVKSTFDVTVVIRDGAVESVAVGDTEADSADARFLQNCQTDSFVSQFIGKTYPVEDIDIATGATVSSNAVLKAIDEAFEQAGR